MVDWCKFQVTEFYVCHSQARAFIVWWRWLLQNCPLLKRAKRKFKFQILKPKAIKMPLNKVKFGACPVKSFTRIKTNLKSTMLLRTHMTFKCVRSVAMNSKTLLLWDTTSDLFTLWRQLIVKSATRNSRMQSYSIITWNVFTREVQIVFVMFAVENTRMIMLWRGTSGRCVQANRQDAIRNMSWRESRMVPRSDIAKNATRHLERRMLLEDTTGDLTNGGLDLATCVPWPSKPSKKTSVWFRYRISIEFLSYIDRISSVFRFLFSRRSKVDRP